MSHSSALITAACIAPGPGLLGARGTDYPAAILAARSRSEAAPIAPAHGLTLEGVDYPDPSQWGARANQARARRDTCCGDDG